MYYSLHLKNLKRKYKKKKHKILKKLYQNNKHNIRVIVVFLVLLKILSGNLRTESII